MKRWILVALVLLLVLIGVGVALSYSPLVRSQRPQQQDIQESQTDHEALNGSCGVERWSVKTGTDADVGLINLQSITPTTVASLVALPTPANLPANNRIQPTETTVFQLHDTLTQYKLETDSDYHLVLADGSGHTMIVEIPDPACVGSSSPLLSGISKARSAFNAHFTVTSSFQTANIPVTVTGVGFFDFLHGQTGVAPNGIELHAVIDIQFGSGGTATPTPTTTPPPTSTPTPTPGPTNNLIQNGGFETSGSWTFQGQSTPVRTTTQAHSGSFSLQLGTTSGQQGDSIAVQMVSVPASITNATLSFFYWPATNDSSSFAWQEADVVNGSGQVLQQLFRKTTNDRTWIALTFDLSKFAGQTIGIQFLDHENSNGQSFFCNMFVDDVSLTVR